MEVSKKPSLLLLATGWIVIITISIGAPMWFFVTLFEMINQINSSATTVIFVRGGYYSLGCGIGMGALASAMIFEKWKKKPLTNKATKIFTRTAIGGLILTFALPIVSEYITENHLFTKGYRYCEIPSSSWPMYKSIHYTLDEQTCLDLNSEDKRAYPSLYPKDDEPVNTIH